MMSCLTLWCCLQMVLMTGCLVGLLLEVLPG